MKYFFLKNKKVNVSKKQGQAMLISVIFFLFISSTIVLGIATPILKQVKDSLDLIDSKSSYFFAEGAVDDAIYRLNQNKTVSTGDLLSANGNSATLTVVSTATGKSITASGSVNNLIRNVQAQIALGTGVAFHYGIQAGNGGFSLSQSATITGNAFSSGPIIGGGNNIYGDVISSGANGTIYGIHATGTAYAHTIGNTSVGTTIDKDAYYLNKVGTVTIGGTAHPNSTDQTTTDLPISDDQISQWESDAAAGGTISSCDSSGNYTISSSVSLGPKKIACNLVIKSSAGVLNVTGPLWVTGNISFQTGPTIKMDSSLGNQNVAIIADNPTASTTSDIVSIGQTTIFQGSGTAGSYVFIISQNGSAENGGSTSAISMSQGASALVAYASHGQVALSQSVSVKEVTAYKIVLSQSANVTYDTGLPSVLFEAGPSGGWDITSWQEVQ